MMNANLLYMVETSNINLRWRFEGTALQNHNIDITLLAPALLAFGELCKEANRVLNGDRSHVQVLLKANVKANTVSVDLITVQTIWDATKQLLDNSNVASAKQILDWLGILGILPAGGLIGFLLWKGKKKEISSEIVQRDGQDMVSINVEGDNNTILIAKPIYDLSKKVSIVENIRKMAEPISESTGIGKTTFIYEDKETCSIDLAKANTLRNVAIEDKDKEEQPQIFTVHIVVYAPVLDEGSKKWKFRMGDNVVPIDISETTIAHDVMKRGKINCGDTYKAKLEMRGHSIPTGGFKQDWKVIEVLEFIPGVSQDQKNLSL